MGFNLAAWQLKKNCQTKVTTNAIFKRTLWEYFMAILNQLAKLNVCQFVLVAKSPNFMSPECTTPTVESPL